MEPTILKEDGAWVKEDEDQIDTFTKHFSRVFEIN